MFSSSFLAILMAMAGGVMDGSFSVPMKYTPKWESENIWGAGSLAALILVPWPLAFFTVPNLAAVYKSSSGWSVFTALAFGIGWGAGGILFGLGVNAIGLSLVPLTMQYPEQLFRFTGLTVILGVCMTY